MNLSLKYNSGKKYKQTFLAKVIKTVQYNNVDDETIGQ